MQSLGDDDKADIRTTIDDDVLKGRAIAFRSTEVTGADGRLSVQGELTLAGTTRPLAFDLALGDDGRVTGTAVVKQSDWGIKPYSALFGALKVADEVARRDRRGAASVAVDGLRVEAALDARAAARRCRARRARGPRSS